LWIFIARSTDPHRSTGATGYIGGTVFDTIVNAHPEYDITVLLRNVPADFEQRYPKVKIVKGDYDSFDTISDAASKANIVVRTTRLALNLPA
jgi:nucleoside-diphosphate-sugar epimerase